MSAYSTSSPSIEQTRWYLIRPPSLACTCRNDTSCDSVAAYSFTGTLTSPKDTAPFQIARISYLRESRLWGQYRGAAAGKHALGEDGARRSSGVETTTLAGRAESRPPPSPVERSRDHPPRRSSGVETRPRRRW